MLKACSIATTVWALVVTACADSTSVTVNQQGGGGVWNDLGTFRFYAGRLGRVRIDNRGSEGYVIADAVKFTRGTNEIVVDDANLLDLTVVGAWIPSSTTAGFEGSGYLHDAAEGKGTKSVTYHPTFPEDGDYVVSMKWTGGSNRAPAVVVDIIHNLVPQSYTLTVTGGTGSGVYRAGTRLDIAAQPASPGNVFSRWNSSAGGLFDRATESATVFTMPGNDVTVSASYVERIDRVAESARSLPVAAAVDVVVVGSNEGGIGAAVAAAQAGASVLLLSPDYYLGHEMAGKGRYWLEAGEIPESPLAASLFGVRDSPSGYHFRIPGTFKSKAEAELRAAGVQFLYNVYTTEILLDAAGKLSGVVIADKAGRQAVIAKVTIDATPTGSIARMAGAAFTSWPGGNVTVTRTLYGGAAIGNYHEFSLDVPMSTGSWPERCWAEQALRTAFDLGDAAWPANYLHMVEPVAIDGRADDNSSPWCGPAGIPLDCFRPRSIDNLFVVGAAASVSRANAALLIRPVALLEAGRRAGAQAAADAKVLGTPGNLHVGPASGAAASAGLDTRELLEGHRPYREYAWVPQYAGSLPVWGTWDVVVVGAGSAGAPAAVGAARAGARVLAIEMLGLMGGTGTNGIGKFWKGYRRGFAMEATGGASNWKSVPHADWLLDALTAAGGDIWFNSLVCGAVMRGNRVAGVVVATPMGRGVVLANAVIDASGDADLCAAAGADFRYVNNGDLALQESSLLRDGSDPTNYVNEFNSVFSDPVDIYSMTMFHVLYRKSSFDQYALAGIRESRLVVGDRTVTALDQYRKRTYSDMIAIASSDFDCHGYYDGPFTSLGLFPDGESYIPYGALIPRGLDGVLVTGRCKSTTHDGLPLIRMQSDLANEGYAAGHIAAKCVQSGTDLRSADMRAAQNHLISIGNIGTAYAGKCVDMPDPSDAELTAAAESVGTNSSAAMLMAAPDRSIPILRARFAVSPDKAVAKVLCMLGDTTAVPYLANWLDGQFLGTGLAFSSTLRSVTDVDGVIWALGMPRDSRAVPALTAKLGQCGTAATDFTHIRSLATSLGRIGSPDGAGVLVSFLSRNGVRGQVKRATDSNASSKDACTKAMVETFIAAALYRCGDQSGLGKEILTAYLDDWRGPFVRFAGTVLGIDPPNPTVGSQAAPGLSAPRALMDIRELKGGGGLVLSYLFTDGDRLAGVTVRDLRGRTVHEWIPGRAGADPVKGTLLWPSSSATGRSPGAGAYVVTARSSRQAVNRVLTLSR